MVIVVTGAAGFIGYHTSLALLENGHSVLGIDNMNAYYDVYLKESRLTQLHALPGFIFYKTDIADSIALKEITTYHPNITHVIHLAAQAGVRYSIDHPLSYVHSNLVGHMNILEMCRYLPKLEHLVYASSSSVYGNNNTVPFAVDAVVNTPKSLYAATKQCDELLTYSYAHLYHLPATALRFFTVYGPWGRPDMAPYLFVDAILNHKPITLFNKGHMKRDFTYITDIVRGILGALTQAPTSIPRHAVYNLGNNISTDLFTFVSLLEKITGNTAIIQHGPMHASDMEETRADITTAQRDLGFNPEISLETGLRHVVEWYKHYHDVLRKRISP